MIPEDGIPEDLRRGSLGPLNPPSRILTELLGASRLSLFLTTILLPSFSPVSAPRAPKKEYSKELSPQNDSKMEPKMEPK